MNLNIMREIRFISQPKFLFTFSVYHLIFDSRSVQTKNWHKSERKLDHFILKMNLGGVWITGLLFFARLPRVFGLETGMFSSQGKAKIAGLNEAWQLSYFDEVND